MHLFRRLVFIGKTFSKVLWGDIQLIHGIWKITKIQGPIVSIFGGSRLPLQDPYIQQAHKLATKLVGAQISIMTGGGAGIMQAANCGAIHSQTITSIGVGVTELNEQKNPCVKEYFEVDYFYTRKWLLTRYSIAFVVFPGGFGTLNELTEILTLIQTKILPMIPIILIGHEYWAPFLQWLEHNALVHGTIKKEHLHLFSITDDLDEAFCLIEKTCQIKPHQNSKE
jgi:uncharacterized protein (TIGR00730 family)